MDRVYVLHHTRRDDHYGDDAKLIGVYRSKEAADAAAARLGELPGFRDHPSGFESEAYELGQDQWTEGFVTVPDTPVALDDGRRRPLGVRLIICILLLLVASGYSF